MFAYDVTVTFFFPVDDFFRFIIFLCLMDFNLSRAKYIFAGTCLAWSVSLQASVISSI